MKKMLFLINPNAGKAEIKSRALEVIDLFVRSGYEVTVHTTQKRLEIPTLLQNRAGDFDTIVACGGDGTLNETVCGLIESGRRPLLGYLPAGTVNDFASSLGLSKNLMEAANTVVNGRAFPCDVGRFGDRYFSYIAAFGAFTNVAYQTPQNTKNRLGRAAYILEGIAKLPTIKAYQMEIIHDHGSIAREFIFGMVTNSISIGGFQMPSQIDVSMNDGLLEVLLVRNPNSAAEATALFNAILRQEFDSEFLLSFRTAHLTVKAREHVPWTLDGEFGGDPQQVEIVNLKHAIKIQVCPPHQSNTAAGAMAPSKTHSSAGRSGSDQIDTRPM